MKKQSTPKYNIPDENGMFVRGHVIWQMKSEGDGRFRQYPIANKGKVYPYSSKRQNERNRRKIEQSNE